MTGALPRVRGKLALSNAAAGSPDSRKFFIFYLAPNFLP